MALRRSGTKEGKITYAPANPELMERKCCEHADRRGDRSLSALFRQGPFRPACPCASAQLRSRAACRLATETASGANSLGGHLSQLCLPGDRWRNGADRKPARVACREPAAVPLQHHREDPVFP